MKIFSFVCGFLFCATAALALEPKSPDETCGQIQGSYEIRALCMGYAQAPGTSAMALGACERMETIQSLSQCVATVSGVYLQESAVVACDRINLIDQRLSCLASASNRAYSESEVALCDAAPDGIRTASCFTQLGRTYSF